MLQLFFVQILYNIFFFRTKTLISHPSFPLKYRLASLPFFVWVMLHACYFSLTPLMWSSKKTKNHIGITQKLVSFDLILPRSVDPAPKYRLPYSDPQGYLASFYTYMNFTSLNVSLPVIIAITRQIATIRFDMKELVQFFPPTLNKFSSL